jgi:hypothetical protein
VSKTRSRRSRIVARIALFAAAAALSTTFAGPAIALAAPLHHAPAVASVAPAALAANLAVRPLNVGHRGPVPPRIARFFTSVPHSATSVLAGLGLALASLLLLGALLAALLGGWLLDFARRSSRTRGQPRVGELAL